MIEEIKKEIHKQEGYYMCTKCNDISKEDINKIYIKKDKVFEILDKYKDEEELGWESDIVANYKEIITKAVIGKTKKSTKDELTIETDEVVDTVLGCWVINNTFSGHNNRGKVNIDGSYDVNVWYSFENNTKTNVLVRTFTYQDVVNVRLKNDSNLTSNSEILIRSLTAPSVTNVSVDGSQIQLNVEKEIGVEVIGDTKVRIAVEDDFEEYDV